MSNSRNIAEARPFSARSVALSILLGSHPPELPARALVSFAELFGIAGGTMRTALSRMVANGDVTTDGGSYRLQGDLIHRQAAQDAGRLAPPSAWDGRWHTAVAAADQRTVGDRRQFRTVMENHRFGELRPDIWMRPANLSAPPAEPSWILTRGPVSGIDAPELARRLWRLDRIGRRAHELIVDLDQLEVRLDWTDTASIPEIFLTSAAVVRFLRREPLLPPELTPADWPAARLRERYDTVESDFQQLLQTFLRAA